jgi:hypothetical protein
MQVFACLVTEEELSLGGVSLGQTERSVLEALGAPSRRTDNSDGWQLHYDGLVVWLGYDDDESIRTATKKVFEILSTSHRFCTPSGICPGDRVEKVESTYGPGMSTQREDGKYLEYQPAGVLCWLKLLPHDGKIKSATVECQP